MQRCKENEDVTSRPAPRAADAPPETLEPFGQDGIEADRRTATRRRAAWPGIAWRSPWASTRRDASARYLPPQASMCPKASISGALHLEPDEPDPDTCHGRDQADSKGRGHMDT